MTPLSLAALGLASCGSASTGDKAAAAEAKSSGDPGFTVTQVAQFEEPWAMAFLPGTPFALITERKGKLMLWQEGGEVREVDGVPQVAYGGQGGLGDVVLAPDFATSGTVYLTWAEEGQNDTRGAVLGRARLVTEGAPRLEGLQVIWRQDPKVTGQGHYSHRVAFSPDGQYLFLSSGERQKFTPAQDLGTNLGKVLRLTLDGKPAPGNPFAAKGGVTAQIWSYGHRNVLGLKFDAGGRLWDLEHGPKGGDELNLVEPGKNYGWPLVSDGDHYDGKPIPRNATRPDLAQPAISWNPVIAPGDFIFYRGSEFPAWRGQAVIAAMQPAAIVRVAMEGTKAREVARYPMSHRIREIEEREDGSVWLLEDGKEDGAGHLLRLTPVKR
ncbi:PQQ-dependent sugar dehydrogenase [Novosphingobium sp. JCM 18896]|uniref:PQQ-dependent sugar dehydrogenase n=1 Tax=Novosphingobium sp. JCM 18896 TaxID=2989731 RepID=UPI0022233D08|nr:PQQ-dependent sugar dehydrogenase [Novosphingobium sp. JCM 18896]MCW1427910.1 PQQ-dependent sugar dehydrogenase [Novosphingobium sp. JCM 18896]